ncbi:P-loop containing nucleoside triphosphate hydrolase protein [Fomitopsis serialis]|uniref:P-loop containing nucleoside triphosphate hydrolase protein n=1 Tax=Fomitopsis serialis TaxID=139415 RepID=UPI002007A4C8|nr:P-loop containing nucleoside triphosphate hydrolase protein [Neoantrodia serialis]KAH9931269.1 P-loop containing nucleoside triphosphate hydrolase protein [Neoantrodia serialis]
MQAYRDEDRHHVRIYISATPRLGAHSVQSVLYHSDIHATIQCREVNASPRRRSGTFDPEDVKRVKHTRIGKQPILGWNIPGHISQIRNCWILVLLYVFVELANTDLLRRYSGQLLTIDFLVRISVGRMGCAVLGRLLGHVKNTLQHYTVHLFHARARLDLQPPARGSKSGVSRGRRMGHFSMTTSAVSTALHIMSEVSMLAAILKDQPDGMLLATISLSQSLLDWFRRVTQLTGVKAMQGLKRVVSFPVHQYCTSEFREAAQRTSFASLLKEPWKELPQIVFTLRAVQYPASIPVSLASLNLIQHTASSFGWTVYRFFDQFGSIADQLATVRKMYDIVNIPNRVPDGTVPFPEDAQKAKSGITVEFRNVSFRYPDLTTGLARCLVIVGANGSGKSTVLKLIMRLYDVEEGEILIDGRISIRDNIALGNPTHATNDDQVRLAAKLGGAEEFIERLPEGFDTYLERPVTDYYSGLPEGTNSLFGRPVEYAGIRGIAGLQSNSGHTLSGGQMQRLAVARTFMRSIVAEDSAVGLLLFDEPSASLDPTAEHDLFTRLRQLRGDKTMLFSSHRFGNLTRHADLILYMNDSAIEETGTHAELLARDGSYARIWKLQAQAFI